MSTSGANEKEEKGGRASEDGQERYLLTVSHSGSFFGNEIRDYVLANEPGTAGRKSNAISRKDSLEEEEEDDVVGKLTYFDYMKILWTKKVSGNGVLKLIFYYRFIFTQCWQSVHCISSLQEFSFGFLII